MDNNVIEMSKYRFKEDKFIINSLTFTYPKSRQEYLLICKAVLDYDDYSDILMATSDDDYYSMCDKEIRSLVNALKSYPNENW